MNVNKKCDLILNNLQEYDIRQCGVKILKSINFNLEKIDLDNKKERNIKIGLLQKSNPILARFLNNSIKNIIDYYIIINNLKEDDIIINNRDGLIVKRELKYINNSIELSYRNFIYKLIISTDRNSYIKFYKDSYEIKGNIKRTLNSNYFNRLYNINFLNKKSLINDLDSIRISLLNSNDKNEFIIINGDHKTIPIKNVGLLELEDENEILSFIDINDIDKNYIWEEIVWKFVEPIFLKYCSL